MESATIKKSLLFSKTESTSKTESNIIFCMIAFFYIFFVRGHVLFIQDTGNLLSVFVTKHELKVSNLFQFVPFLKKYDRGAQS